MKREYRFILPTYERRTAPTSEADYRLRYALTDAHSWLRHALVRNFDGFTATEATGAWFNGKAQIVEPVILYDVAIEELPINTQVLREIAHHAGTMALQECVYLRDPSGNVEFINMKEDI